MTQVWKRQNPDKCRNQLNCILKRKCNGTQNIEEEAAATVPTTAYKHAHTHTNARRW